MDRYPPIVARAVLIDVAKSKGVDRCPIPILSPGDLQDALKKQGTTLRPGDVVLTRTELHDGLARSSQVPYGGRTRPKP